MIPHVKIGHWGRLFVIDALVLNKTFDDFNYKLLLFLSNLFYDPFIHFRVARDYALYKSSPSKLI